MVLVNEVNFFPNFKPLTKDDPRWQTQGDKCNECHRTFHMFICRRQNCVVCGKLFCKECCHPQRVYNGQPVCGGCVAVAMVTIKQRYDKKRLAQVRAHHAKYHGDELSHEEPHHDPNGVDELYGRAYDALQAENHDHASVAATAHQIAKDIGGGDIELFPEFEPMSEHDPRWQKERPHNCPECHQSFHVLTHRAEHCRVCGHIFCNHCCHPQMIYKNYPACGACVGAGMVMVRKHYDEKRAKQLREWSKHYQHPEGEQANSEAQSEAKAPLAAPSTVKQPAEQAQPEKPVPAQKLSEQQPSGEPQAVEKDEEQSAVEEE